MVGMCIIRTSCGSSVIIKGMLGMGKWMCVYLTRCVCVYVCVKVCGSLCVSSVCESEGK